MFNVLYLPPSLEPIGMARWLKAEFLHCSRMGGFFILVDLLSGCGVGVGGVGIGFVIGVGSGEVWAGWADYDDCVCMLSSQNGATPLYIASANGHSQVAELLLSKGANVNLPKKVQYMSKCNKWYIVTPIINRWRRSTSYYFQGY